MSPGLQRPFTIVAFDWDGTAVMSRQEDAGPVRALIQRLLDLGIAIVITGANFPNIDRQLSAAASKRNLLPMITGVPSSSLPGGPSGREARGHPESGDRSISQPGDRPTGRGVDGAIRFGVTRLSGEVPSFQEGRDEFASNGAGD
jgi:hypothetical protein